MEEWFISIGVTIIIFMQGIQIKNLWNHEKRLNIMESCLFGNPDDATSRSLTEKVNENNKDLKVVLQKLNSIMEQLR